MEAFHKNKKVMEILAENKKALFNYYIIEGFEAGIVLNGQEVKSIKTKKANLLGSYAVIKAGEIFLINASIPPFQPKNIFFEYNPLRTRKLLLKKKEIQYLTGKMQQKGLTLVPLKMYTKKGKIKLEIAIAKGKGTADKREAIKKRDVENEMRRQLHMRG